MKKSVLVKDMEHCIVCGRDVINRHHVFHGTANRKLADQDGYWVPLCQEHHTGRTGVHFSRNFDIALKQMAQRHFEESHTRQDFIGRYGKSYL